MLLLAYRGWDLEHPETAVPEVVAGMIPMLCVYFLPYFAVVVLMNIPRTNRRFIIIGACCSLAYVIWPFLFGPYRIVMGPPGPHHVVFNVSWYAGFCCFPLIIIHLIWLAVKSRNPPAQREPGT